MKESVVGWFLPRTLEARAVWFEPVRYVWRPEGKMQSPAFLKCPAYQNFTQNLFVLRCPFDLHLRCALMEDGCELSVGDTSSIKPDKLQTFIKVHPKSEWREPDKPLLQLMLNYYFLSDDDVELQYLSPLTTHVFRQALPGLVLQGRWRIRSWVRPVNFVFEWWNTESDLVVKRGEPLLNVMFHGYRPDMRMALVEAEETEEVISMAKSIQNINSYITDVFSVLPSLLQRRPRRLVKPCPNKSA